MKEFFKWLGVNEKVAKVAIWMLIIMIFLIVTNTMLDSLGFPYYKITVDNIQKINSPKIIEYLMSWILALLNFYTVIFLVFKIKEFKKIFPYSILYLLINIIIHLLTNSGINQIFITGYIIIFCYLFSNKKWKYVLYAIISIISNVFIQYIWFLYKAQELNMENVNETTCFMLGLDFFIIMFVIIIAKEIYLKKRSEKGWQIVYSGLENSNKKESLQKK